MSENEAPCREVSEQIGAYLDNELPPANASSVCDHLQRCLRCRDLASRERSVRILLHARRSALREPLRELVRQRVVEGITSIDVAWRARRWKVYAVATLALVALLTVGYLQTVPSTDSSSLVTQTVDDHIRYRLNLDSGPHLATSNPQEISDWLWKRLDIGLPMPPLHEAGLELRGGRVCYLLDRRIASLQYELEGHRYSLFIIDRTGVTMPRGEEITVAGQRACLTSYKGYCVAVWEASGLIYTLISDVEARRLAEIVATISRA